MWHVKTSSGVSKEFESHREAMDTGIEQLRNTKATVSVTNAQLTDEQFINSNGCRYCAEGVSHAHHVCCAGILNDIGRFSVL